MFEYNAIKIVLVFFIFSGILNLLGGTYLGFSKRGTARPTKLQASGSKLLLRGISTEVLSLVAYGLFRRGLFEPWQIFVVFMVLIGGTELLIARILNRSFFPSGNQ